MRHTQAQAVELRDTLVPGFLCKITRRVRKVFMLQYRTNADKAEARKASTIEELCKKFMEDHSKKRNKPSTRVGYQGIIDRCIIPLLGRKKVHPFLREGLHPIL